MESKEKRTEIIRIRFTRTKLEELKARAKEKNMTLKRFILTHHIED